MPDTSLQKHRLVFDASQLKRKLRQLKKLEANLRFKGRPVPRGRKLIWDVFFSTKATADAIASVPVKYPFEQLVQMDHPRLKEVIDEYLCRIYLQIYQDYGFSAADVYDARLLSLIGLPPYASSQDIKQRYRELAKKYHPDMGGDADKFIELAGVYEKLLGKNQGII